jgi:Holliday junction resolvasome RuvABC ATP-dependent DNA helicase subunit
LQVPSRLNSASFSCALVKALARIISRSAGILGVGIDPKAAEAIAERSRGTPRVAKSSSSASA